MATTIFWLIVAIGAFALDVITSSFLFVWFTLGGLAAIVANLLGASFIVQLIVFAVVSLISVGVGYPYAKNKFKKGEVKTPLMEETYIGKEFISQQDIDNSGNVKIGGIYWGVINEGVPITKGEKFKVVSIEGNKFKIKKIEEE